MQSKIALGETAPAEHQQGVRQPWKTAEDPTHAPSPSSNSSREEAREAADALEDLAIGQAQVVISEPIQVDPGRLDSKEQFARDSILLTSFASSLPTNPNLPWNAQKTPQSLLAAFLSVVGPEEAYFRLCQQFMDTLAWVTQIVHYNTFLRESRAFWTLVREDTPHTFDPVWIALSAAFLSVALAVHPEGGPNISAHDLVDISALGLQVGLSGLAYFKRTLT